MVKEKNLHTAECMFYSVQEVAMLLGISRGKAYELTHSKGFPAISLGRRILIRKDSFHKWLEGKINDKP